jgi:cell wall-associated NlpC family hydrolase
VVEKRLVGRTSPGDTLLPLSTVARSLRRAAVGCVGVALLSGTTVTSAEPIAGGDVADLAQHYVGSRYAWGGSSPAGFDCTGFVMWVYSQFGVSLPHNEAGQLASGPSVAPDDLQPGDVLAFANTYRRGLSHVGIYLGGGRFVHAGDESHGVLVDDLWDGYWGPRFVGASRPAS